VLRSFLNFLFQKGRIAANLAAAVPSIPHRRLAELPHYLEAHEVERVLSTCDRRRRIGKRDYAIFLLLARLGLRAGEVIRTLLNWYQSGADVEAHLPELATYLGHVHVRDSYWYLSAVPELLKLATVRWERAEKGAA
jgi:site-specific recombinase XerC